MSEYVEKCPCCNNHSLEVAQHDWGDERRCELCGFAVAPSVPTQAHVGNAVAFVSAACSWFDEKRLDMPLDEHLAEVVRSGAGALVFAGERKVSRACAAEAAATSPRRREEAAAQRTSRGVTRFLAEPPFRADLTKARRLRRPSAQHKMATPI
jgi:hypothetical protein